MGKLSKQVFICLDCETTGLDTDNDQIIEVAAIRFTCENEIDRIHSLVKPSGKIPAESTKIHNITDEMVADQPSITEVLPGFLEFIGKDIVIGHGVNFDITVINNHAKKYKVSTAGLSNNKIIDTLRLARYYGESPNNTLEVLRRHFNIPGEGAHRALNDVKTTISVFKHLTTTFHTTEDLFKILDKPIPMRRMPLGKYKGRLFTEIPLNYLQWAAHQKFDKDLLYSLRRELKNRKKGNTFTQATNPFAGL